MAGLVIPQGGYLDSLCNQGHHIFSGLTSVTVRKTFLEFKELDPDNDLSLDVFTRQTSEPTKTFSQLVSEQARTSHQKDCDLGDGLLQAFPYTRRTSEPTLARLVTEHANTFHRQYSERTTTDSLTTLETPSVEDCLTDQDDGILQTFPYMNSPVQSPSTANSCIITRDRATQVHDVDCDVSSTGHSMGLDCVHDCPPIHPPLQQPQASCRLGELGKTIMQNNSNPVDNLWRLWPPAQCQIYLEAYAVCNSLSSRLQRSSLRWCKCRSLLLPHKQLK